MRLRFTFVKSAYYFLILFTKCIKTYIIVLKGFYNLTYGTIYLCRLAAEKTYQLYPNQHLQQVVNSLLKHIRNLHILRILLLQSHRLKRTKSLNSRMVLALWNITKKNKRPKGVYKLQEKYIIEHSLHCLK